MSQLNFEGMAIADGVVETIISMAAEDVEGVVGVVAVPATRLLPGLGKKPAAKGVEVVTNEDGSLAVSVRVNVKYGFALPEIAKNVREAIANAALTQIGMTVSSVDVFIDAIQF